MSRRDRCSSEERSSSGSPWGCLFRASGSEEEDDFDSPGTMVHSALERLVPLPAQLPRSMQPPTTLYWVRMNALRCHDNEAFATAISDSGSRFRAVFIMDPWYTCLEGKQKLGLNRLRFLLESLHDVDKQLQRYGTRLYVVKGHPLASLECVCNQWNVTKLVFQADREVRSHIVEETVERLAQSLSLEVQKFEGHTLYDTKKILDKLRQPITTIKHFRAALPLLPPPVLPTEVPHPPYPEAGAVVEDVPDEYCIPMLTEVGYPPTEKLYSNRAWVGGESEALKRLELYMENRKVPRETTLELDDLMNPTALSPYIRFGCLSVRYFLFKVKEMARQDDSYIELAKEVTSKLLQREFYFFVSSQVPNFDQYNNSVCVQLPWEEDSFLLKSWTNGCTGYPWIDAAMRQLWQEGWIHHWQRESVAIFLTRGDLWQNWVEGKKIFEESMLDFEPCVSSGCWMKSSCSAFITGPVEHFCPITFGKKIDPHGLYIRHYIPELQHYPDEYIFSPWLAPHSVQEECGCKVGTDYPNPIIDHRTAGVLCCEKLRSLMAMLHHLNNSTPTSSTTSTSSNSPVSVVHSCR